MSAGTRPGPPGQSDCAMWKECHGCHGCMRLLTGQSVVQGRIEEYTKTSVSIARCCSRFECTINALIAISMKRVLSNWPY